MTLFWLLAIIYLVIFITLGVVYYVHYKFNYWDRAIMPFKPCPFYQGDYDFREMKILGTREDRIGIFSYSLYGNYKRYCPTLYKSIDNQKSLMPKWQARVYIASDSTKEVRKELLLRGAELIIMGPNPPKGHEGALWRFLALEKSDKMPFVCLDADDIFDQSVVNKIKAWQESGQTFCSWFPIVLAIPMTAGYWGCKGYSVPDIKSRIAKYCEHCYGFDEMFLKKEIWPLAEEKGCWFPWYARADLLFPYIYFFLIILMIVSLYLAWRNC